MPKGDNVRVKRLNSVGDSVLKINLISEGLYTEYLGESVRKYVMKHGSKKLINLIELNINNNE